MKHIKYALKVIAFICLLFLASFGAAMGAVPPPPLPVREQSKQQEKEQKSEFDEVV